MSKLNNPSCPECDQSVEGNGVDRRDFIRTVSGGTASLVAVAGLGVSSSNVLASQGQQATPARREARPAEAMIRELFTSLSDEQKRSVVMAWDHGRSNTSLPTRMRMFNAPMGRTIGEAYTPAQKELVQRILRSISSDEEGYRRITRNGTFDGSRTFDGCGAYIFGDPTQDQYAWVFMGHHLTVRCDGNSVPGAAFGGPIYYGHSPNGYSQRNVFYYQTQSVRSVFDALNEQQRRQATVTGSPGEQYPSVRFRGRNEQKPGISSGDLTADQRRLVEQVMRDVLSPFRREDADEVMQIVRRNGGLEQINLAFYRDRNPNNNEPWHFWRLEGPGFVWNYRVLPHVHTFVNISSQV